MKRICMPLLLAAVLAMVPTAWATPSTCPGKTGTASMKCPRVTGDSTPATCPVKHKTCVAQMEKRPTCGRTSPKVMVKEEDGWKLVVHILQPGSRSQGYHGLLYKDGERMEGKKGEALKTPWGTYTWQGAMDERANLWDSTGWVSKDGNPFAEEAFTKPKEQASMEELDRQIEEEMKGTLE
ncbi:hypothetical protein [Desulfoluna spongiiphila]|uniref:hypothetical protein n=1 Tax=Desulfoluna spongiiphila TaxID=419481 RepID=UPI001251CC06|nr:hypothetical protein [Desulfoluna spongiiphila]VVS93872.1 consensus disorder prediction [Desulfoluna spongiiphila]